MGAAIVFGGGTMSGCGGSANDTLSASGTVQYDGAPVATGEIRFRPIGGTQAVTVGAVIRNGRYEVSAKRGLSAGKYRVEIVGYRNPDGSTNEINLEDAEANYVQYIPSKHNQHSQATITIESTSEPIVQDFVLTR